MTLGIQLQNGGVRETCALLSAGRTGVASGSVRGAAMRVAAAQWILRACENVQCSTFKG